jgi:DNA replication protein DnaC
MNQSTPYDPDTIDMDVLLRRLHLANARRAWPELCQRAEKEAWSFRKLLAVLFAEEIAHRAQTRHQRAVREARFPFLKTIDDFDFSLQSTLRLSLLGSYLGPELASEGRNLILYGKTGRGKTHLAVAVAYKAILNGFTARFSTAAALIDHLSDATRSGNFREALAEYVHPTVLAVDEVGYLTYRQDAANVLFHVVNERHIRKRPIVFTTNKSPFTEWGDVLHDHDLANAIVDRTLERGRFIVLDGPSYRTRHIQVDLLSGQATPEPDRVSGKSQAEFPEPTRL